MHSNNDSNYELNNILFPATCAGCPPNISFKVHIKETYLESNPSKSQLYGHCVECIVGMHHNTSKFKRTSGNNEYWCQKSIHFHFLLQINSIRLPNPSSGNICQPNRSVGKALFIELQSSDKPSQYIQYQQCKMLHDSLELWQTNRLANWTFWRLKYTAFVFTVCIFKWLSDEQ